MLAPRQRRLRHNRVSFHPNLALWIPLRPRAMGLRPRLLGRRPRVMALLPRVIGPRPLLMGLRPRVLLEVSASGLHVLFAREHSAMHVVSNAVEGAAEDALAILGLACSIAKHVGSGVGAIARSALGITKPCTTHAQRRHLQGKSGSGPSLYYYPLPSASVNLSRRGTQGIRSCSNLATA